MSTCPICSTHLPDESKFCLECGYSFSGGQTGRLNPDTMLENRYIIVKTLGRGGMGAVYLALDTRLNNKAVAVKEMSTNAVGSGNLQAAVGAFKKEASMLVNLHHPSLPIIRDFFAQGEDRWYLVMDYIEGHTLKQVTDQRGAIPEAEVLNWAHQLCEILSYLHNQKPPVIFRDLKPANIMLTPDGTIKLVDFGIARHFRPGLNADTAAYGSAGFAPPEQYGKNQTDERSDIYALGATLYYLLTGIDPNDNPFHYEPLSKIVRISDQFEAVVMQCLDIKPENRPGSVAELLRLLPPVKARIVASPQDTVDLPSTGDETATLYLGPNTADYKGNPDPTSSNPELDSDPGEAAGNRPTPSKTGLSFRKGTKTILAAGLAVCLLAGAGYGIHIIKVNKSRSTDTPLATTSASPAQIEKPTSEAADQLPDNTLPARSDLSTNVSNKAPVPDPKQMDNHTVAATSQNTAANAQESKGLMVPAPVKTYSTGGVMVGMGFDIVLRDEGYWVTLPSVRVVCGSITLAQPIMIDNKTARAKILSDTGNSPDGIVVEFSGGTAYLPNGIVGNGPTFTTSYWGP